MDPGNKYNRIAFILAAILIFAGGFFVFQKNALATTGINEQVNFQGKLVNTNGTNIADGTYNMEFKIYQDGDGVPGGGDETLKWTEDRLRNNSQGVTVTDGIFQVNLGSVTAFSGIDWNQSVLWVSINIGNTNATCTPFSNCVPDGEMNPMVRFTAAPYALNADKVHGLTVTDTTGTLTIANSKTVQFADAFTVAGAFATTLTATNTTNATLPVGTVTLAALGTAQTWTANQTFANSTATDDTLGFNITTGGAGRFAGTLTNAELTGAHSWILPNLDGTVALTANKLSVFAATTSTELSGVLSDENTSGGYMTDVMTTAGDLIYGNTSGVPARLAGSGTNGWVLTYNTGTSAPEWAVGGGGHTQNTDTGTDGTAFTIGDGSTTFTINTGATDDTFYIEQGTYDSLLTFTQNVAAQQEYIFSTGGTVYTTGNIGTLDHGSLTGLTDDDHSIYALLAGRTGGQTLIGGTVADTTLTLQGNSTTGNTATNANLIFKVGDSGATTAMTILNNGNIGINTTGSDRKLDILDASNPQLRLTYTDNTIYSDLQTGANGGVAVTGSSLTVNGAIGFSNSFTIANATGSASQYGEKLVVTSTGSTAATLYGKHISFVDATSTANTIYGLYVDASTANASDTQYAAAFMNGNVGIGTATPTTKLYVQSTTDSASLGGEMITNVTFTGNANGWTLGGGGGNPDWYYNSNNVSHANGGGTATLEPSTPLAVTAGASYWVSFDLTDYSAGSVTASIGGANGQTVSYNATSFAQVIVATNTNNLKITPTNTFVGNIDNVSVKLITTAPASFTLANAGGTNTPVEFRSGGDYHYNTFIGFNSGKHNTTGYYNSAMGSYALSSNTTGSGNSAVGYNALLSNTTGWDNSAMGSYALLSNTTGYYNSAMGNYALRSNTAGDYNSAMGSYALSSNTTGRANSAMGNYALLSNTTGWDNSAMGNYALLSNTTGRANSAMGSYALLNLTGNYSDNTALGYGAGQYQANGSSALTSASQSIYIGSGARGYNNSDVNSIVIGYQAIGIGANSVVLGNDSITKTILNGNVGIGTTGPDRKLDILDASNPQLRLTYTDNTIYSDLQTGANGGLALTGSNLTVNGAIGFSNSFTIANATGFASQYGEKLVLTSTGAAVSSIYGKRISFVDATSTANTIFGLYVDASTANANDLQIAAVFKGGNVGIGTGYPLAKLDIYYNESTATAGNYYGFRSDSDSTGIFTANTTNYYGIYGDATASGVSTGGIVNTYGGYFTATGENTGAATTNAYGLYVNGATGADNNYSAVFMNGNVGIGTTGPDRKLDILDASNPQLRLTYTDNTIYSDLQTGANGGVAVTGSSLTVNGAIGFSNSFTIANATGSALQYGEKLVVTSTGSTAATLYGKHISFVDATSTANTIYGLYVDASTANASDTQYAAAFMNGNVGIGTAAPSDKLDVSSSSGVTGIDGAQIDFETTGTTASVDNSGLRVNVTSNNSGATTTLEGIDIANLVSAEANSTETALRIGTGWDTGISVASGGITIATGTAYTGSGTVTLSSGTASALTIDSGTTGDLNIGTDASGENIYIGTGAAVKTLVIGSTNTTSPTTIQSGTGGIKIAATGSTVASPVKVQIGEGTGSTSPAGPNILRLDVKGETGDPTGSAGINGSMYYNSADGKFRCYENNAWKDCIGASGGTPGGADTNIQFNDGGTAFGGEADFTWDKTTNTLALEGTDTKIDLKGVTNEPSTPPADNLYIYSKEIAGRIMPKWKSPTGFDTPFQAFLGFNGVRQVAPASGTTASTCMQAFGTAFTNSATTITQVTPTTGSVLNQVRRVTLATSTTSGEVVYNRANVLEVYRGDAAGRGGFFYAVRFALAGTLRTGNRAFFGLVSTISNPTNIDPTTSAALSKIGMGINASTGNWNIIQSNGTNINSATLGANFPVNTTDLLELVLFGAANGSDIGYRVTNLSTGNQTSGTLSTYIPATTTFLAPTHWITNNAQSLTSTFALNKWYLESDY